MLYISIFFFIFLHLLLLLIYIVTYHLTMYVKWTSCKVFFFLLKLQNIFGGRKRRDFYFLFYHCFSTCKDSWLLWRNAVATHLSRSSDILGLRRYGSESSFQHYYSSCGKRECDDDLWDALLSCVVIFYIWHHNLQYLIFTTTTLPNSSVYVSTTVIRKWQLSINAIFIFLFPDGSAALFNNILAASELR